MADAQLRDRYLLGLLERVREEPYPSVLQMDLVESVMTPDALETYTEILLEKIEGEQFPSPNMLQRLQRLVALTG
jgi:hypothetical protein